MCGDFVSKRTLAEHSTYDRRMQALCRVAAM
jgi:hypothetical protein